MRNFSDEKPEDFFKMATILPKKKLKVNAHLEDKDGERIELAEIAEELVAYIDREMTSEENTNVNSYMFPLLSQFSTSLVPRFIGIGPAAVMFSSGSMRNALMYLALSSSLFTKYMTQHELKIVTETEPLTDAELEEYVTKSRDMENRVSEAFGRILNGEDDDDTEDDLN